MTERMTELGADGRLAVVMGDLNVGHRELDIKNWKGNQKNAGFLPRERGFFDKWLGKPEKPRYNEGAGLGWVDVGRALSGEVAGPYTWWSWRGQSFDNDSGWRIDYQLASPALAATASGYAVDRAATYAERWSDHAPVVVDYSL
jgi:exodeoxyribonuclease-3